MKTKLLFPVLSVIISVFMLGLDLGSWLGGRPDPGRCGLYLTVPPGL